MAQIDMSQSSHPLPQPIPNDGLDAVAGFRTNTFQFLNFRQSSPLREGGGDGAKVEIRVEAVAKLPIGGLQTQSEVATLLREAEFL